LFLVVVSGLSDIEIPEETCPEGMIHMEIEGLAMGGATSPSNKQKGYVAWQSLLPEALRVIHSH
jgi:hypothetical protein